MREGQESAPLTGHKECWWCREFNGRTGPGEIRMTGGGGIDHPFDVWICCDHRAAFARDFRGRVVTP